MQISFLAEVLKTALRQNVFNEMLDNQYTWKLPFFQRKTNTLSRGSTDYSSGWPKTGTHTFLLAVCLFFINGSLTPKLRLINGCKRQLCTVALLAPPDAYAGTGLCLASVACVMKQRKRSISRSVAVGTVNIVFCTKAARAPTALKQKGLHFNKALCWQLYTTEKLQCWKVDVI